MKLIVAEVVLDWSDVPYEPAEILPKPEGTTWYPDGRVFVRTVDFRLKDPTPSWLGVRRDPVLLRRYGGRS